jgi:hypothetical protein
MKRIRPMIVLIVIITQSCSQSNNFIKQKEDKYQVVDGKRQIVAQTIKTLRKIDSLPVKVITKIFNYENDTRLLYLTGLSKEDGLQEYSMDSIFYDNNGNDTLTKSFVHLNNNWKPTQIFLKRFSSDKRIKYFMIERPFKKDNYFKKETFYIYNNSGNLSSETEVECRQKNVCDSTYKRKYVYSISGKLDSTISYSWRNSNWGEIYRRRNSR